VLKASCGAIIPRDPVKAGTSMRLFEPRKEARLRNAPERPLPNRSSWRPPLWVHMIAQITRITTTMRATIAAIIIGDRQSREGTGSTRWTSSVSSSG
jgi:hypothetical protein